MNVAALLLWMLTAVAGGASSSDSSAPSQSDAPRRLAFTRSDSVEKFLVLPTIEQRTQLEKRIGVGNVPRVFQVWRACTAGRLDGYAIVDDVIGKSEPITYMLVVEPDLRVRAVEILSYRESRG